MPIKLEITEAELLAPSALNAVAAFLLALGGQAIESTTVTRKVGALEHTVTTSGLSGVTDVALEIARRVAPGVTDTDASTTAEDHHVQLANEPGETILSAESAAAVFGGEAPKPAGAVEPTPPAPVAPVAPTAPAPTAPVAPNQNSGIVTDKAGLPWDRRIHSESKSINKTDGLWRAKRGRDESLTAGIEAELRAAMAVEVPKPGLDPSPTVDPAAAPVAPVAPTVTAPPAPLVSEQGSTTPKTLGELMVAAQALVASGKIASLDVVRATAAELGIVALPLLGTRPDMCEAVYNKLIAL